MVIMEHITIEIDEPLESINKSWGMERENECVIQTSDTFDSDTFVAKQLDYSENYTLMDLKKIADYYDIIVRKLRKDELIQEIVLFEIDPHNCIIYFKRVQGWEYINLLMRDNKLKKYILF